MKITIDIHDEKNANQVLYEAWQNADRLLKDDEDGVDLIDRRVQGGKIEDDEGQLLGIVFVERSL